MNILRRLGSTYFFIVYPFETTVLRKHAEPEKERNVLEF